jgi:hypothetical protein
MATSSSAKKVARVAAKSGSGTPAGANPNKGRNWMFAAAIVAIVGLGVGIVAFARAQTEPLDNKTPPRANLGNEEPSDHWHAAFAIEVCGTELAPLQDGATDPLGIHTHGDGLIHIHPFSRTASGERATMGKFFDQVGLTVTDTGFELPEGVTVDDKGSTVKEGETTCGGEEGELVMAKWTEAQTAETGNADTLIRDGFESVRFEEDYTAFTLAFVPKGSTDINPPSTSSEIEQLGAVDAGGGAAPDASGSVEIPTGEVPTGEVPTEDGSGSGGTG